ncbi:Tumor susceptibility gene 101 protein [Neolecta irregularis DAH-3]|uniref:Tumor susceptibility gene 101 protein n=1 Tax=Neolecta irregularis (strain DAH-3) TaxID=1198029 RepID=A0A1U7LNE6_NEOID|nr:Tumor susceptibility gene 101 protein [Neolecta irregularis DAH-3]|eukprot:OLL24113.1 Tumor susceptibility gene 101 protein [Neolecta irregularis DAH-3]
MTNLQHVLNWLQRVLAPEYSYTERTQTDVINCLSKYPSLAPRTDIFTYEDGQSVLLLCLEGIIPIVFRDRPYNIPIAIWIPHCYPKFPPISFVLPSKNMLIRPGNHVDSSGRIYHPYLAYWEDNPSVS